MRAILAIILMTLSLHAASVWTTYTGYANGDSVAVGVAGVTGENNNWVGVFRQGSISSWDNIIDAKWFNFVDGNVVFDNLPTGRYEVRLFYNDTLTVEATSSAFDIGDGEGGDAMISTNQTSYQVGEGITVSVGNVQGQHNNWIGIFPEGVESQWDNLVLAQWFDFTIGTLSFVNNLPAGNYEVRLFYNDTLNSVSTASFTVEQGWLAPTVYEDAENGNIAGWSTLDGPHTVENVYFDGTRAIYGSGYWLNGGAYNAGFYQLLLDNGNYWNNTSQRILELDFNAGNDTSACFQIGVEAQTTQGFRMIMFSAWYGRHGYVAARTVYSDELVILTYPLEDAMEYLHANYWKHFRADLQEHLEILEPGNQIIAVESFILNGTSYQGRYKGHVDNIKLSSE